MTDFRDRYKRVGYDRGDVDINRALRSQRRDEDRRDARTEHFGLRRNLAAADQDDTLEQDEIQRHQDEEDSNKNTGRFLRIYPGNSFTANRALSGCVFCLQFSLHTYSYLKVVVELLIFSFWL